VYDPVLEDIALVANSIKLGGPKEEGYISGPLISAKQLTRVMGFIAKGKNDGVEGGHRRPPARPQLAKRLQARTVTLKCQLVFDHAVPFGGTSSPAGAMSSAGRASRPTRR
jgi:hypothetical protein